MRITAIDDSYVSATQSNHIKQGIEALLKTESDSIEFKSKKLHYSLSKLETKDQYKVIVSHWTTNDFGKRIQRSSKHLVEVI